jgi:hypothetical protein
MSPLRELVLDDKDEFVPYGGLAAEVRDELNCNLGSALFTNFNLLTMWLSYYKQKADQEAAIEKFRNFYIKYKDTLDDYWSVTRAGYAPTENWVEKQIEIALRKLKEKENEH